MEYNKWNESKTQSSVVLKNFPKKKIEISTFRGGNLRLCLDGVKIGRNEN